MIPAFLASGMVLYGFIQFIVAFLAVYLAVKWNKHEFLPGLFFLLLYAIIELIDLFFLTILNSMFIDVAQFGFILLAIIFFMFGMHPVYSQKLLHDKKKQSLEEKSSRNESAISLLKKI